MYPQISQLDHSIADDREETLCEVNCVPLSDIIVSGRPWVANILSRTLIVAEALVDAIVITSSHCECESTKTR